MQENQRVSDMAVEVLSRQASIRAKRLGESFEGALKAVLETAAGQQLAELRDGPFRDLPHKRAEERSRVRQEERKQARQEDNRRTQLTRWKAFMQAERRELELRKNGQLVRLLGEPLPGEPPAEVVRLASEDRRQAEEGIVALMSEGEVYYKHIDELSEGDMPARIAAKSVRVTWLKERQQDRWFGHEVG
jgi:hypothetical protein